MLSIAEAEARYVYELGGCTLDDRPSMLHLAQRALGAANVFVHRGLRATSAYLPRQRQIWLRAGLSEVRANFALGHELGEWRLHEIRYEEPDRESVCDAIAGCLVCPRVAFQGAVRVVGSDFVQLAQGFGTSQTVVGLRYGETTGHPVVVVTERNVHARGGPFEWGDVAQLRRIAGGRIVVPELERRVLTDAPRRVALIAA